METIRNNPKQSETIRNNPSDNNAQNSVNASHNADYITNKLSQLRQIIPEIFSENSLDLDKLKQLLGDHIAQNERYALNWAGKSESYQALQRSTNNTLIPCRDESVDFDHTQNIFIESDNLEALKILQKSYAGKIKMIYIDPPYNTGNDFIYHDDFSQSKKDYEIAVGDRDIHGQLLKSFKKNSKDNGHYHSNWLNMMLPRLHLARTLLANDGVIFISIDDNEQAQLKLLCDEIFGEENFVAELPTIMNLKGNNDEFGFSGTHEYTLVYMKNKNSLEDLNGIKLEKEDIEEYNQADNKGAYKQGATLMRTGEAGSRLQRPKGFYPIYVSNDLQRISLTRNNEMDYEVYPIAQNGQEMSWRRSPETLAKSLDEFIVKKTKNGISFYKKQRLSEDMDSGKKPKTLFYKPQYSSGNGTAIIKDLFDEKVFQNPKPLELLKDFIRIATSSNDLVLDFFAGSGSLAHAIMELNCENDKSQRNFICIQLPEILNSTDKNQKIGYDFCIANNIPTNIAEISKERIRRAGAKIKAENPEKNLDTGFKVFKLASSNFKAWHIDNDNIAEQLALYIDPLVENAQEIDIVYELLLRMGLKLTADIHFEQGVYWLSCENKLYAIVLDKLSQHDFNTIIAKKPAKTVALDKVFQSDSEKSNVILQFKDAGLTFESI